MKVSTCTILFLFSLGACTALPRSQPVQQLDPSEARRLLVSNFEDGIMNPWYDTSPGDIYWDIEDTSNPIDGYPVPTMAQGTKYLRAKRSNPGTYGMGILRSLEWTALPGDQISVGFWVRSKYATTNTLDVNWMNGTEEVRLMSLTPFSSINNLEWRTRSAVLPVTSPTTVSLIIYGYCGSNSEDAIALDNLKLVGLQETTSTAASPSVTSASTDE